MNLPFSNTTFYENLHILSNDATHDTLKCNFAFTHTLYKLFSSFCEIYNSNKKYSKRINLI